MSSAPPPGAATAAPLDTDDTRSQHLGRLARHPVTLSLGATAAIAALFAGAMATESITIGAAAAAGALLLTALIVFVLASGRAKEDFFRAYADGRGLSRAGSGTLPPATPLLRRGDKRYAHQIMRGSLPGEVD